MEEEEVEAFRVRQAAAARRQHARSCGRLHTDKRLILAGCFIQCAVKEISPEVGFSPSIERLRGW